MRFQPLGAAPPRIALVLLGFLASAACSLTEAVRTMPGAPGEIPFSNSTGGRHNAGGDAGLDAGDGSQEASAAGKGGRGGGGASGRSGAGGSAGDAGPGKYDGSLEPKACPVDITFACHDYCGALSLTTECGQKLRDSAGVKPDGGADFPDGSVSHPLSVSELVQRCKCDCELHYRTEACAFDFDEFIMCAEPPLSVVCATEPDSAKEMPSVIGPCGGARTRFLQCLAAPPPPVFDAGP